MALVTYHPSLAAPSSAIDQATLYVTTKSLYTQALASFPDSLLLVQAGIIIASYEYASRKINEAFCSISICARIGYALGLHLVNLKEATDHSSQAAEKHNTWWGIVIAERSDLESYYLY